MDAPVDKCANGCELRRKPDAGAARWKGRATRLLCPPSRGAPLTVHYPSGKPVARHKYTAVAGWLSLIGAMKPLPL